MTHGDHATAETPTELRILLIEDNEHDRVAFSRALRACPYNIRACERAEEALALLTGAAPEFDVVVVDYNLPGDNGLALCRTLLERGTLLPVILLTARGQQSDLDAGMAAGADAYLVKPFSPLELLGLVSKYSKANP